MGIIKGIIVVVCSVLLFLSFFSSIIFLNLSNAMEYNSLQSNSVLFIKDLLKNKTDINSTISENLKFIQIYCINNSNYIVSFENYTIDIPCSPSITSDQIIEEGAKDIFSQVYFKEYSCELVNCFKKDEPPLFLISQKMYNYLLRYYYLSLLIVIMLSALLFFLIQKKSNLFILFGSLLLVPSLISLKINSIPSLFKEEIISKALGILFINSYSLSIKLIALSISLIFLGIIFKMFKIGMNLSNFIQKFVSKKESSKNEEVLSKDSSNKKSLNKK